jgi:hypothetical protein
MTVLVCVSVYAAWALSPPRLSAQGPLATKPKCVGIATAILRAENPVVTRVYRVFEDGTVETYDDGAPNPRWTQIGR